MIKTKEELKEYLKEDFNANKDNMTFIKTLLGLNSEHYMVRKLLFFLRHTEYYYNNRENFFAKLMYHFYKWHLNRITFKMQITIPINTVGKGIKIAHWKGGIALNCLKMGDYCIINSGAMIGNKNGNENRAIIGNHVELTFGCKIVGKVTIGDYAIIAPNSVVIKDVPAYSVVSGVPAKVIKQKQPC